MNNYKRREVIKLSALGFAGIALGLSSIASYAQKANGYKSKWDVNTKMNWDAFLERLTQIAKTQHEKNWNQKNYVNQVKQLLLSCDFPQFENIKKEIDTYENRNSDWFESTHLHHEVDFEVSFFQFEKGEYIPHHDHPQMTGVFNVLSGNVLAKNYDIDKYLSTTREMLSPEGYKHVLKKCVLKEVGNEVLKAGDVGLLTADEGNIHSIMPNEYTQLVDVFTPAYKMDTNPNWYEVNQEAFYNGKEGFFEAEY